jgi:23S rRNA pseudouridine2605 synthase
VTAVRIQKALAAAGVASRRAVEAMILDGRITLNGRLVTELPCFVDLETDDVRVDGQRIGKRRAPNVYYLLNKPAGVVCTQRDPRGRPRAVDLVPPTRRRVYCVGRLDEDSTGLVILTDDGALTDYLTHPRYGVAKRYRVEVDGRVTGEEVERLKGGLHLDGRRTGRAGVKVLRRGPSRSLLEVRLTEGRNREVRRLLARLGHKVRKLRRVAIGPVTDKGLKIGGYRLLRASEVLGLRRSGRAAGPQQRESEDGG